MSRRSPGRPSVIGIALAAVVVLSACGQSEEQRRAAESMVSAAAASSSSVAASSSAAAAASSAASARSAAAASSSVAAAAASAAARLAEQSRSAASASSMAQVAAQASLAGAAAQSAAESAASAAVVAAAAAAAAGAAPADPDTPGQEGDGSRCAGYEQYADEEPVGMRADAAAAWLAARAAGEAEGLTMCLADGKRSRAQQQQTYDDYVGQYGQAMADQYVLPPEKSAHVLGLAIDVQPYLAYTWLESTDGAFDLCRRYDNEAWHFEFDPAYSDTGCPARLPDPGAPTVSPAPTTG